MYQQLKEEWSELSQDFKKLESLNKEYHKKLEDVVKCQKECSSHITHQKYRISILKDSTQNGDQYNELRREIAKREAQLDEIQQTLPRENGQYLKIILGGVNVYILNKEDKLKYKSEYENFKLLMSCLAFILAIVNIIFSVRGLELLYMFILVWYYSTLTIRESILKVNGSRIKGWWRVHHFISSITAAILLIWPEGNCWSDFRVTFFVFNAYLSIVQYRQFVYQKGILYRLKALGERDNMDITIEGFHKWMWKGLSLLFPILLVVYLFQFYMACVLYNLSFDESATWHVQILSLLFLTLSVGNITTMVIVINKKKYKGT